MRAHTHRRARSATQAPSIEKGVRPLGRRADNGRVVRVKPSGPQLLLPLPNRRDPGAAYPPIPAGDAGKGLLNLITRGFIPSHADLTPAFVRAPAPVLCGPARVHPWEEQFSKATVATGSNVPSSLRLDLLPPPPLKPPAEATTSDGAAAPRRTADADAEPSAALMSESMRQPPVASLDFAPRAADVPQVDSARGYNQLLDTFSLHQFMIRRAAHR